MKELLTNVKVAAAVSGATTSSGIGTYLDWIPGNIGWISCLIGAVLSTVLIYFAIVNGRMANKELRLRIEKLNRGE